MELGIALKSKLDGKSNDGGFGNPCNLAQTGGGHISGLFAVIGNISGDPFLSLGHFGKGFFNNLDEIVIHTDPFCFAAFADIII